MANPVVSSLTQYTEEHRLPLIKAAVLGAKTIKKINVQTDIKHAAALNLLSTNPVLADGSNCGWSATGTAELSQRILTVAPIKVNMAFCDKNMLNYWTGYQVKVAAGQKTLPFEQDFLEDISKRIAKSVEEQIWQGNTSDTGRTDRFNGFIKLLDSGSGVNSVTYASGASAYNILKALYMAIPEQVLDRAEIYCGADMFRKFIQDLVEKNYYHIPADQVAPEEIYFPGTNVKIVALNGLNSTGRAFAGDPANFFYGCDLVNDSETFDVWYSKDNQEFRLACDFVAGVQVAYPSEIVETHQAE